MRAFGVERKLLAFAKPVLGAEPALPPTVADVAAWSRLLDAGPPSPGGDGPLLARGLGRTAYVALVHEAPGLAEAALRKAFAIAPELKAEEADLYFAAAWDLYDDCRRWWDHALMGLVKNARGTTRPSQTCGRLRQPWRLMAGYMADSPTGIRRRSGRSSHRSAGGRSRGSMRGGPDSGSR